MQRALLLCAIVAVGCGGEAAMTPSTPTPVSTPTPAPAPRFPIAGRVTVTQTGAPIPNATIAIDGLAPLLADAAGNFSADAAAPFMHVVVSASGYVTRETRIGSGHPVSIDLIATAAPFSLIFYGQLVRNLLESSTPEPVRVLSTSPSIYLQTTGLSGATVTAFRQAAAAVIPALSGGRLSLAGWETGETARADAAGWITVELISDDNQTCGRARIGDPAGHVWMNTAAKCARSGAIVGTPSLFAHELGHALGFYHVDVPSALMHAIVDLNAVASEGEKYHAAIAYHRQAGNRDPDVDAPTASPLSQRAFPIVVD